MKTESSNFIKDHYDWLVALGGFAALGVAVVFFLSSYKTTPEGAAIQYKGEVESLPVSGKKIDGIDMSTFAAAMQGIESPVALKPVVQDKEGDGNFLASARRVTCVTQDGKGCGLPIPAGLEKCPFCQASQVKEVKVAIDSDNDGIPNDVELAWGLDPNNPADAGGDLDGDGFTNLEEYVAKTDPKDPKSHPDYLDSLSVSGKPETTTLPVVFENIERLGGQRFRYLFRDPNQKNAYGARGVVLRVENGQEIGKTGFAPVEYTEQFEKKAIKGGSGMTKKVDVSTVRLVRKSDNKEIVVKVNQHNAPIDMQVSLLYSRGTERKIDVTKGSEFDLNGQKYKVMAITPVGTDGAEVTVRPLPAGKEKVIK